MKKRLELEERIRFLEKENAAMTETMNHLATSMDNFIKSLEKREEKEDNRFEKFRDEFKKIYYVFGGLVVIQFLIAKDIIKIG